GTGEILVLPANIGGLPSSGTITATVGPLPSGVVTSAAASGVEWHCPGGAGETTITCTSNESLRVLNSSASVLSIPIEVTSGEDLNADVSVELSGGGAPVASTYQLPLVVSTEPAQFGMAAAWAGS